MMGELSSKANGRDPVKTNGKLRTVFKRVEGCKKLDRMIAKKNMKAMGITGICKGQKVGRNNGHSQEKRRSDSKFATHWRDYVY